ncbi:4-amino-4-deoxy-L-arabinose transferase-like glycosyltransferase [Pseudorhizobium tarimense]|uniref:4-amino-4-deoxy-L-arabinose transferase-like glycosyltransferase n=1 Tax=Pseudorhizobium tarimense TaxID=1079109 RepID=A0ABV2H059_9HYPH|nr:glycosyltransferase family 39 protein [Pseudorhizobium tarimense]MCJ8517267.1 glycosyltransferase family 39 protein [Pseudorhizobium tarimense]
MLSGWNERIWRLAPSVLWIFAIYYACQVFVRLALPDGLRIDEAQQVFLSQWLAAGYDAQPPLYNWLQQLTFQIVGDYLVGLAVLKSMVLFAIICSYYVLARMLVNNASYAVMAALGLFLIPQMFWQAQRDLTHTTATMLLLNLLMISAVVVLRWPSLRNYLLLGAAVGLGMLTKYNFALFLPALAVAVYLHPNGRARILDWRIVAAAAIAVLIVLPHAFWFIENLKVASSVTVARMGEDAGDTGRFGEIASGLGSLLAITLVISAPALAAVGLPFGNSAPTARTASSVGSRFIGTFLVCILLILVLLIFAVTLTTIRDRWMLPLLQMLPLYGVLKLEAQGLDPDVPLRRLMPAALGIIVLLPIATFIAGSRSTSHYQQPYDAFRTAFTDQVQVSPAVIATTDWTVAGNLKMRWPQASVISTQFPNLQLAYDRSTGGPVALMWRGTSAVPPEALVNWARSRLGDGLSLPQPQEIVLPFTGHPDKPAPPFHYILIRP